VLLSVDRHLVQTIVPGTRLTVVGIYSVYQASASAKYDESEAYFVCLFIRTGSSTWLLMVLDSLCSQKGAVGVKQPYIRVVGLEPC
jgi:DNA replication licensing factor MCM5